MSCMILITLFQVLCSRFLWPPCKGDNGWLVMVVIALLVMIAWLIIFRKPSLRQELQVMWSRLWSKNSKLMTFPFNILMFLHLLHSLNCWIPFWVRTWHPFLHWRNCRKAFFSLMPLCRQRHPPLCGVLSLLSFTYTQWCYLDKPWMNCGLWIMTRSFYKKSNFCWLILMGTSCLNCCQYFWPLTTLPRCKAWTKSMMAMLGVSWS